MEEFIPVKTLSSHPHVDPLDGSVWNVGTAHDPKRGYSYAVVRCQRTNPTWSGTMILENAQVGSEVFLVPPSQKNL